LRKFQEPITLPQCLAAADPECTSPGNREFVHGRTPAYATDERERLKRQLI